MFTDYSDSSEFFAAMQQIEQGSFTISTSSSSESMTYWSNLSMSVRQVTNNKGETYPSDFGVGLPPLASQDDY